jgi:biopolymer transport protein ExbB
MPTPLIELWEKLTVFIETGGDVLLAIFAVTLLMWTLILERFWYFSRVHPKELKSAQKTWASRKERASWEAEQIRRRQISELHLKLNNSLSMIKTLVAVCPLLGLLGTVTGMIEVFDVMAMVGSGNARAMASGVYMATIPTMAGMVAALSGVYFIARLERLARRKIVQVKDTLSLERGEVCAVG